MIEENIRKTVIYNETSLSIKDCIYLLEKGFLKYEKGAVFINTIAGIKYTVWMESKKTQFNFYIYYLK